MSKLAIGAGIAKGAENFVNSYAQARAYKEQQKFQKHQIILSALYKNLEDDNIPYSERAKIFDAIPNLLGIKMDTPLSQAMGLQQLLDDEVETQSGIEATPAKEGTIAHTITDDAATQAGLADTINQQATADVPATLGRPRIAEKFGDLSPAKYKQLITNRQQDIDTQRSLEFYRRKAEIDFELQQDSYKAQGYNKVVTEGFNSEGEYVVLMANQSNDIKEVKMPKGFQPTKILAKNSNTLPAPVRAYSAYFETQLNPTTGEKYTPQEAQAAALEYYKQNGDVMFGLTKAQKEATTQGTQLRNTGEMPMSPTEKAAREDRLAAAEERKDTIKDTQEGILRDANTQLVNVRDNLTAAESAHQQAKAARDGWIKSNGTKEGDEGFLSGVFGKADHSKDTKFIVDGITYYVDPSDLADDEYKVLNQEFDRTRQETSKWRNEQGRILGNIQSAEQRIKNLQSRGASSGSSNSATITISPTQIETFRKNNASNAKVRNMTDDEIRQLLMRNKNRWQP